MTVENVELIESGGWTLVRISEGHIHLQFEPPLRVNWSVYCDSSHPAGAVTTAYINFDFGMSYEIKPVAIKNGFWRYGEITKDSTNEEVINSVVRFDLFHAFTHYQLDPNYDHLHWALYGNLKDQVKVIEESD